MLLCLGPRAVDVTTRAIVMGTVAPFDLARAEQLVGEGAGILAVDGASAGAVPAVAAIAGRLDVPVAVVTTSAEIAGAAFAAGACLAIDPSGFADPGYLPAAAAAGAGVVAVHGGTGQVADAASALGALADAALAAGVQRERILVDAGEQAPAVLRGTARLAALGWPLLLGPFPGGREAGLAAAALAVGLGCRVVRAGDVRGARRVCDTLAAVLEAA
ncbi:MAG TPA: dihydropteroate synthase [Acidimicrobiales bacterium]|nr:dihydropteroate synthase [Acidimicrobiales bacterium]